METIKHTPGPWDANHDADGDYAIFSFGGILVCVTESDDSEDAANANLIAAAPDMLVALKAEQFVLELTEAKELPWQMTKLLESVGDYESGWGTSEQAIEKYTVKAALLRDAAIAKAEGK